MGVVDRAWSLQYWLEKRFSKPFPVWVRYFNICILVLCMDVFLLQFDFSMRGALWVSLGSCLVLLLVFWLLPNYE